VSASAFLLHDAYVSFQRHALAWRTFVLSCHSLGRIWSKRRIGKHVENDELLKREFDVQIWTNVYATMNTFLNFRVTFLDVMSYLGHAEYNYHITFLEYWDAAVPIYGAVMQTLFQIKYSDAFKVTEFNFCNIVIYQMLE
jgi:hypothetical protein